MLGFIAVTAWGTLNRVACCEPDTLSSPGRRAG